MKLVLPGPIATEIWELQPGELPGLYDGPFVTADDCAADIVRAIEDPDGFEYYTPELVPGGWAQKDLVVGKTQNCDQFLTGMAQMAAGTRLTRAPWFTRRPATSASDGDRNAVEHRVARERIHQLAVGRARCCSRPRSAAATSMSAPSAS